MTLARYQFTVVDDAGNVQDGATVTVRAETIGNPLASLFSDRAGVVATGNPVTADSEGYAAFHVAGGAYMITATKGSFTRTWRYVAIGLMAETDGGSAGRALLNLATTDIVQFGGLDLPIGGEIRWDVTGSPETADVAITHSAGALAFTGAASGYSFDAKVTGLSFGITSVAPVMIAGPSSAVAASTMATEWLWGESAARTALTAEGAIWAGAVHNGVGIAKTFTSAHNQAVANTGPAAALFAYARNDACNADVVGVLADAHAVTANQTVFGANFIGRNDAVNGVKIVGCEIDVEFAAGTTAAAGSAGLYINVFNVAVPGPAIQTGELSGGSFNNGLVLGGLASTAAGVSPNGAETMGSLLNSGAGVYGDAAIVLSNDHRLRLNGTASAHAQIFNDAANALRIVGGSVGTAFRNNADSTSILTIFDDGTIVQIAPTGRPITIQSVNSGIQSEKYSADANPNAYLAFKSRNTAFGSHTVLQNGDAIARFEARGSDGTGFISGGYIEWTVDGTPGTNDMPTRAAIFTTPDGSATPVERFRVNSVGLPIFTPTSATPATLATNGQITMTLTSNTNLRFSARGSDGNTRVANLTLA